MTSFDDLDFSPAPAPAPHLNGHDPQDLLISCALIDPSSVVPQIQAARLDPSVFGGRRTIFRRLLDVFDRTQTVDAASLAEELQRHGELEKEGGIRAILDVSQSSPSTLPAQSLIDGLRRESLRRHAQSIARDLLKRSQSEPDIDGLLEDFRARLTPAKSNPSANTLSRPPSAFSVPPDGDSSILLGNRFLNRGDGMVISSTSGMGKSSLSLQLAVLWALGRPALASDTTSGIAANGPLRSLIIQSEDSDGDVAEVWAGIVHSLNLTPKEIAQVNANLLIVTDRVNRGLKFRQALKAHIAAVKPDLVWINPLQAFMDGDVTQSQDLGKFLREELNSLNHPAAFAYILVHHTTKPATGKDRQERQWHEVMYDMAGGAEIINWARAILSLRPAPTEGEFNLLLAKRGRRAGFTRATPQGAGTIRKPETIIPLRHAQGTITLPNRAIPLPIIFWEPRDPDKAPPNTSGKSAGRPSKHDFNDYRTVFPANTSLGLELAALHRQLCSNKQISKSTLFDVLKRWVEEGLVEVVETPQRPTRYRASKFVPFSE